MNRVGEGETKEALSLEETTVGGGMATGRRN